MPLTSQRPVPRHMAIIMDGNGRWAKQRGLPRLEGHRQGAKRVHEVVAWAAGAGIPQLSLFAFSTENWARPKPEVSGLMTLLASMLPLELPAMQEQGVRLRAVGDLAAFPPKARKAVEEACRKTEGNNVIDLVLCLNYGGQQEIIAAAKRACQWVETQGDASAAMDLLNADAFRKFMWSAELQPVDFLVRTGGEKRISNFYLWDAAYAELYFTDAFWPDFSKAEFETALADFAGRERRFGLTSEQVNP